MWPEDAVHGGGCGVVRRLGLVLSTPSKALLGPAARLRPALDVALADLGLHDLRSNDPSHREAAAAYQHDTQAPGLPKMRHHAATDSSLTGPRVSRTQAGCHRRSSRSPDAVRQPTPCRRDVTRSVRSSRRAGPRERRRHAVPPPGHLPPQAPLRSGGVSGIGATVAILIFMGGERLDLGQATVDTLDPGVSIFTPMPSPTMDTTLQRLGGTVTVDCSAFLSTYRGCAPDDCPPQHGTANK